MPRVSNAPSRPRKAFLSSCLSTGSKILSSPLCPLVRQEHRRYLRVCQPRYLSVPQSLISFPALSCLSFISSSLLSVARFSCSSFVLSLSLSLPLAASLFPIVSSTRSCSPAFAQALNAIYDHRYVLSRHIRSGWSLAFSPFALLIASLFGLLVESLVLLQAYLARLRSFQPTFDSLSLSLSLFVEH